MEFASGGIDYIQITNIDLLVLLGRYLISLIITSFENLMASLGEELPKIHRELFLAGAYE